MAESDTNQLNGAEAMVRLLEGHGVRHIFGLCGDTTLPFYDALYRLDHNIEHILTRDERSAAYMADGYARVTGRVGVCEGPSGGGATYILPGLVEANESSIPILAITSDVSVSSQGHYPLTELDQQGLMRPLTKWNAVIPRSDMVPDMVRRAFRTMTTGRPGSAHLGFPIDVQRGPVNPEQVWSDATHATYPARPVAPDPGSVAPFLDALLTSKSPLIICGGGVVLAGGMQALDRFASALDLPVATTISGHGALSDHHPLCLGVVGSNGGVVETRAVVEAADLVIFIGCRAGSVTTERWRFPAKSTRILHIDSDPEVIGASYSTEAAMVGDARLCLEALSAELAVRDNDAPSRFNGTTIVKAGKAAKWALFNDRARSSDTPIRPERTLATLQKVVPDDVIIVADPGTPCPYMSAWYQQPLAGRWCFSNRAHGALGYAMSAAMGAHIGQPDKKVIAMMGDGSFGFTCGELETVVRKRMPIVFIVFSNAVYGWIKAGQRAGFDERYYSVDFSRTDHAAVAAAFGLKSWKVTDPDMLDSVMRQALETGEPALIDIISQPLNEAAAPVSEWIA